MAEQVHAHAAVERGVGGAELASDRVTDPLLERRIEGGAARHADREGRRLPDDDAARAVAEREARDAEPRHGGRRVRVLVVAALDAVDEAVPEGRVAVEAAELLLERHRRDQRARFDARVRAVPHPGRRRGEGSRHGVGVLSRFARSGL